MLEVRIVVHGPQRAQPWVGIPHDDVSGIGAHVAGASVHGPLGVAEAAAGVRVDQVLAARRGGGHGQRRMVADQLRGVAIVHVQDGQPGMTRHDADVGFRAVCLGQRVPLLDSRRDFLPSGLDCDLLVAGAAAQNQVRVVLEKVTTVEKRVGD